MISSASRSTHARGRLVWQSALVFVFALAGIGCATTGPVSMAPGDLEQALAQARAEVVRHPADAQALRDLGALLVHAENYQEATQYLERSLTRAPDEPKTLYYLGLAEEAQGDPASALRRYGGYTTLSQRSPFRHLMAGRYTWLLREQFRREMEALLAREDTITAVGASLQTVAVYPFGYLGSDTHFAPLGRGLGEMITVDLASLSELRVVERVRLQALLDEMALVQGDGFDPATVPRVGRLLGAGRVVGGFFDVRDDNLQVDAGLWAWEQEPLPDLETHVDALDTLFALKREIVLALLDDLGVARTPAFEARIAEQPTRSLQAFLLYSRGLREEDAGRFGEAAGLYREALRLDPGFGWAATRAERAEGAAEAGGGIGEGLAAAILYETSLQTSGLLGLRLGFLNASLGNHLVPGLDSRNPAVEATGVGAGPDLPDPPPPPVN